VGKKRFADLFDDYLAFLEPRLVEAHRVLAPHGCLYVHLDYREVHYCKVLLDAIFDRACFLNEIIWAYDYGGRPRDRWPPKHDTILLYAKVPGQHVFNVDAIERIPYMAPGLVGPEKAARGKLPTDTWWHTIVPTNGSEKTGYPTQKPLGILRRIIQASSHPGAVVLDFFAGSGTTGIAALELGAAFHSGGQQPGSPSGDGPAIRWRHGDRMGRLRSDAMLCHSLIGRMHSCQVNPGRSGMFLARWNNARPVFCIPVRFCPSSPNPFLLKGRVLGKDEWFSVFLCAFAPHPPTPFSHKGRRGSLAF
jgi:hypothetical protein